MPYTVTSIHTNNTVEIQIKPTLSPCGELGREHIILWKNSHPFGLVVSLVLFYMHFFPQINASALPNLNQPFHRYTLAIHSTFALDFN